MAVGGGIDCVAGWIQKSVSAATWSSYTKVWRNWVDFVKESGEGPVGDQVRWLVLCYVARLLEEGVSASAVNKTLAGLAFWFKLQGQPDFTKDFWVRQAMKGYRKAVVRRDTRRPVTFGVLGGIVEQLPRVCSSLYEVALFKAAFLLAFFGAFRVGELVSPSKKVQGGNGSQEVVCGEGDLRLFWRRSKTDQTGKGRSVRVFAVGGSELCPVGAVREFLALRPQTVGSFLIHSDGSPVSRFQFVAVFRKCLGALGLIGKEFSSHSFRIGAATEAARAGMDGEAVKRIGRWESRRFQLYVRPHLAVGL